jgi:hypothetical protein
MTISAIRNLEQKAPNGNIRLYKEGTFWIAYERSAFHFFEYVKPYKILVRHYKQLDDKIVRLGFPVGYGLLRKLAMTTSG